MRGHSELWDEKATTPLVLKRRLQEGRIDQARLAKLIKNKKGQPVSRSLICGAINHNYLPPDIPDFKGQVEEALEKVGVSTQGIWELDDKWQKGWGQKPRGTKTGRPSRESKQRTKAGGDEEMNITRDYLDDAELRHFGLEEDPFYEIHDFSDIYLSPQLKVVERRFYDTVKRHGIMAIVGDIGAGKSTLLRYILTKMMREKGIRPIVPDDMDREKLTGRGLTSAIISTLGAGHSPRSAVDKDRLAKKLLEESIKNGVNPVLIIDEAHDLKDQVIVALKRIWDSGLIFRLLAIVIVGQGGTDSKGYSWGLKDTLENSPTIREFAERCYVTDIGVMNGHMADYLSYRFKKAGADAKKVFSDDALKALSKKAEVPNRAHNIAVRAMRAAYQDGQGRVSMEHINDVFGGLR